VFVLLKELDYLKDDKGAIGKRERIFFEKYFFLLSFVRTSSSSFIVGSDFGHVSSGYQTLTKKSFLEIRYFEM
jgi:hypothetical protein